MGGLTRIASLPVASRAFQSLLRLFPSALLRRSALLPLARERCRLSPVGSTEAEVGEEKQKKKQKKKGSQNEISLVFRANGVSFGAGFFHRFSGKFKRRFHRQKRRRHQSYQRRSEPPGSPLRPQPQGLEGFFTESLESN